MSPELLAQLPGAEWVLPGLADLRAGRLSIAGVVCLVGRPRLLELGLEVPALPIPRPEHALYAALEPLHGDATHARYNAIIRRLVSFTHALARAQG